MNRIYKVIWSTSKNCYVVVSEFAKVASKSKIGHVSAKNAIVLAALLATSTFMGTDAYAADESTDAGANSVILGGSQIVNYTNSGRITTSDNAVAIGGSSASGPNSVALGGSHIGVIRDGKNGVAIGGANVSESIGGIAIGGESSTAGNYSLSLGYQAQAGTGNGSISRSAVAIGYGAQAMAHSTVAIGDHAVASANVATAIGSNAKASGQDSFALGHNAGASGKAAIAIGVNSKAPGVQSVAIGEQANAAASTTVAIGYKAQAIEEGGTALGYGAIASSVNSVALGRGSNAIMTGAVAIGQGSIAGHPSSVALGVGTQTSMLVATDSSTVKVLTTDATTGLATGVSTATLTYAGTNPIGSVSIGNDSRKMVRTLTNLAAGRVNDKSTDAVNGSQLYGLATVVDANTSSIADIGKVVNEGLRFKGDSDTIINKKLGDTLTLLGGATTSTAQKNIAVTESSGQLLVQLANTIQLDDDGSITVGSTALNTGGVTVVGPNNVNTVVNSAGIKITPSSGTAVSLTDKGLDNGDKQIVNVKSGLDGADASIVSNVISTITAGGSTVYDTNGANIGDVINLSNNIVSTAVSSATSTAVAKATFGLQDEQGNTVNQNLNKQIQIIGDDNIFTTTQSGSNPALKVNLSSNLNGLDSITFNNGPVIRGGSSTTPGHIDMKGGSITNLKSGIVNGDDSDNSNAANIGDVKQLLEDVNDGDINNAINKMGDQLRGEIADAGANAAALAALKPLQYDPMEPTQIMAGYGNYRGSSSLALGVAHFKNESTMFHAGVAVGGHHNMYNAGVTWKFGSRDEEAAIPDRYKAGPISSVYVMQDEVSAMKTQNARLLAENKEQKDKIADQDAKIAAQDAKIADMNAKIQMLMARAGL